jgi:hypothetical protein
MSTEHAPARETVHSLEADGGLTAPGLLTDHGHENRTIAQEEAAVPTAAAKRGATMLEQGIGNWLRMPIAFLRTHGWGSLAALMRRRRRAEHGLRDRLRAMTQAEFEAWVEESGFGKEIRDAHTSAEAAGH